MNITIAMNGAVPGHALLKFGIGFMCAIDVAFSHVGARYESDSEFEGVALVWHIWNDDRWSLEDIARFGHGCGVIATSQNTQDVMQGEALRAEIEAPWTPSYPEVEEGEDIVEATFVANAGGELSWAVAYAGIPQGKGWWPHDPDASGDLPGGGGGIIP